MATAKSFKADISSVSPSKERMEELWVVCFNIRGIICQNKVGIHCNYTRIPGGGGGGEGRGKQHFQVNLPEFFFYLKQILHTKIQFMMSLYI